MIILKKNMVFDRCPFEHTLSIKRNLDVGFIVVSLYMDDLVLIENDLKILSDFKIFMIKEFDMTDLGELHHFLGIEVHQGKAETFISQESYAREIIKEFKMKHSNSVSTPCLTGLKLRRRVKASLSIQPCFEA